MPKYNRRLYGRPKERKGVKVELPKQPRELEEIHKDYSQLCAQAGQAQYQVSVFKQQLEQLNKQILVINEEAAARQKLNQEKQAEDAKKAEEAKQGDSNVSGT